MTASIEDENEKSKRGEGVVKLKLNQVVGSATVFRQGGSLRIILPRRLISFLNIPRETDYSYDSDTELPTIILVGTDKGILMRKLTDFIQDEEMSNKIGRV